MRYLITGGAGFIGSHLADELLKRGHEVFVVDDLSTGSIDNIKHLKGKKGFSYVIDSCANVPVMAELVDSCDRIFHLAAAVGVKLIVESPVRTIETNVHLTEVMLTLANKKKRPILVASTSEVYGKSDQFPFREDGDLVLGATNKGRWSYACSKAIDEFLAIAYWKERKLPTVVVRLFNTVGPRQTGQYGMVIPNFVRQALAGVPITVYGDGKQSRCFTHVADVVRGLIGLLDNERCYGQVFNIGNTSEITHGDPGPAGEGDLPVEVGDPTRALRRGVRKWLRGHAPTGAGHREDRRGHRLEAHHPAAPGSEGRDRALPRYLSRCCGCGSAGGGTVNVRDYVIYFVLALGATLPLVYLVRSVARRLGLVAKPRADRWHRRPTALFGGVAMFAGFTAVAVLYAPADFAGDQLLLLCAAGMFGLGLLDDLVRLKPYSKLVGQIVFSTAFTLFGARLHWLASPVLDQALTIFWLVGIANAVNLLDNLDGLAGGVAAIASAYLVFFCHASGQYAAAAFAAAFCGAVVAFLFFNFNPASIFMGDCGSLFLGFFLGGLTAGCKPGRRRGLRRNVLAVLAIPVLLLLIPIVDTTLVTITRKFHGRPVSQGGRDHTSHRLVALGAVGAQGGAGVVGAGGGFGRRGGAGARARAGRWPFRWSRCSGSCCCSSWSTSDG